MKLSFPPMGSQMKQITVLRLEHRSGDNCHPAEQHDARRETRARGPPGRRLRPRSSAPVARPGPRAGPSITGPSSVRSVRSAWPGRRTRGRPGRESRGGGARHGQGKGGDAVSEREGLGLVVERDVRALADRSDGTEERGRNAAAGKPVGVEARRRGRAAPAVGPRQHVDAVADAIGGVMQGEGEVGAGGGGEDAGVDRSVVAGGIRGEDGREHGRIGKRLRKREGA